jgi:hypothetical protein
MTSAHTTNDVLRLPYATEKEGLLGSGGRQEYDPFVMDPVH